MKSNVLAADLDHILQHTATIWDELRNKKIFMTGGTGFFGRWFLETFIWANQTLNLNIEIVVLTRNAAQFAKKSPHLFHASSVRFYEGDVQNFIFPEEKFSYIIHAATEASAKLNETNPFAMIDTIIKGTAHTLEFARHCMAEKFLLTSSGAVYGRQPPELSHISEEYPCQPRFDNPRAAYAVGKCTAEHLCTLYANQYGLDIKIARCFAFVGPYLPLDIHFAIGNFIRDGLQGERIHINGDGTPYRSYLYAADLIIWLLTILLRGKTLRPYNVGSDEAINIADLANIVAGSFDPVIPVKISRAPLSDTLPERYVPDIKRARDELGLRPQVDLKRAIEVTKNWYLNLLSDNSQR